jgi:acyl-CoA thioester hydrolase
MAENADGWPFVQERRVEYGELDAMRHVNNTVFARWFETARLEFLHRLDPTMDVADPGRFGLILASLTVNYRAPAAYAQGLRVMVRCVEVGASSITLEYRVEDVEDGQLVADGRTVSVTFDYVEERSIPVPDDLRAALRRRPVVG